MNEPLCAQSTELPMQNKKTCFQSYIRGKAWQREESGQETEQERRQNKVTRNWQKRKKKCIFWVVFSQAVRELRLSYCHTSENYGWRPKTLPKYLQPCAINLQFHCDRNGFFEEADQIYDHLQSDTIFKVILAGQCGNKIAIRQSQSAISCDLMRSRWQLHIICLS